MSHIPSTAEQWPQPVLGLMLQRARTPHAALFVEFWEGGEHGQKPRNFAVFQRAKK